MTLENEKRFLLLLSSYTLSQSATKQTVLDAIADNNWATLSAKDLQQKTNRNELIWRNDFAFVRKHLVTNGWLKEGIRNDWSITDAGILELHNLYSEVLSETSFSYISDNAKRDAVDILRK